MATGHQYRHNHRYILDGVYYPKSQNKESKAIQLKLNELIAASRLASNRMVDIEDLTEDELNVLHKFYKKLSDESEKDDDIHNSHSIDAADDLQMQKDQLRKSASNQTKVD